ncbi:unnamed protein product [Sympodiomycopsis kandeliae]
MLTPTQALTRPMAQSWRVLAEQTVLTHQSSRRARNALALSSRALSTIIQRPQFPLKAGGGIIARPAHTEADRGFDTKRNRFEYIPSTPARLPSNTVINFVPQQTAWVVERMGKFHEILEPGVAILIPLLDRIAYVQSHKESSTLINHQGVITADNVTLSISSVLYTRVVDPKKASYGVEDVQRAVTQLAQTTMRSEIGKLTLDTVLRERANLNAHINTALNEAAAEWGIRCLRHEIKDVIPPIDVEAAMHRQVSAERNKRADILVSEGARQSAINIAEGQKQQVILASEAKRDEAINLAKGEAEATFLKAQATAKGLYQVAKAFEEEGEMARAAASLNLGEKYIEAFAKLAKEGTAVVVPGGAGDMSQAIASAMAVYDGARVSKPTEAKQQ